MRNDVRVLLRNFRRERLYALINILGLALGVACFLVIGLFLKSELTYDRHFDQHQRIYRVVNEITTNGTGDNFAISSRSLGPMLAEQFPEVQGYVRFRINSGASNVQAMRYEDKVFYWEDFYFVDPNVFEVFSHEIIHGDPQTALAEGNSVAISQRFARRYFGDENPVGKVIYSDSGVPQKVTLVFGDLPVNTHLKYDMLFSNRIPLLRDPDDTSLRRNLLWNIDVYTYLLMDPGFQPGEWKRINDEFFARNMAETGQAINSTWNSALQPLANVHLQNDYTYDRPTGNRAYIYGCAAVALFILFVACINYMNLATARAARRTRATGIRKILGATRGALALQFLGEALLFAFIATALGVAMVQLALMFTPLAGLMEDKVSLGLLGEPWLAAALVGLALLVGVVSGLYPALYLSSWAPLTAITGKQHSARGALRLREALVLVQFTISAGVIAATLLMLAQMHYVADKSLGFGRENRLVVTLRGLPTIEKIPSIRKELATNAHVLGVAEASTLPGQTIPVNVLPVENAAGQIENQQFSRLPVSENFIDVMGLEIVEGRDLTQRLLTDVGTNVMVNEALVRKMNWDSAIGRQLMGGRVVGVVGDFHFKSLHTLIEPIVMHPLQNNYANLPPELQKLVQATLVINISGEEVRDTMEFIEKVMLDADPGHPFDYKFLDDILDAQYRSELRLTQLIGVFAAICIFISCLGLFGLAAFTTEQRTREIGTRKVLGATAWQIVGLLARRILVLVLVASVLAGVAAYFAVDEWLSAFSYRAGINPLIFVLAAAVAAAVAFGTVAAQSWRTAHADPVESLRHV